MDSTGTNNAKTNGAKIDNIKIDDIETRANTIDDDVSERVKGKVDIIILEKTNKTPILISC